MNWVWNPWKEQKGREQREKKSLEIIVQSIEDEDEDNPLKWKQSCRRGALIVVLLLPLVAKEWSQTFKHALIQSWHQPQVPFLSLTSMQMHIIGLINTAYVLLSLPHYHKLL